MIDYEIAVFAANEARTLTQCLKAIDYACAGSTARVVVILNGTTDNSISIISSVNFSNFALSMYRILAMDKANAINQYIRAIRSEAASYVFIDGYNSISPQSLRALSHKLRDNPTANIASGVPSNGRSADVLRAAILKGGTVHGGLHAIRPEFVNRLVAAGLRFPDRLYRVDGLLGSMACHDLDAIGQKWKNDRVLGVAEASFAIRQLSLFNWQDIKRQYRREVRQARGRYESEAIKSCIYAAGYAALPSDASDMIRAWSKEYVLHHRTLREKLFMKIALYQAKSIGYSSDELVPERIL